MTRALAAIVNAAAWMGNRALATVLCERLICDFPNTTNEDDQ